MGLNMLKKYIVITLLLLTSTLMANGAERNNMPNQNREEICKTNFEELFKTNWNPNLGSDPEMMAILQKYIFGEVFATGNLDNKTREMLTVTTLCVQQTLPQLKAQVGS